MKKEPVYLYWGLTAFSVICGVILFYDLVFRDSMIIYYAKKLAHILAPVVYGFVIAYLLTPVVNWVEKWLFGPAPGLDLRRRCPRLCVRGIPRGISILLSWAMVAVAFYFLLNALLPELYRSVVQLANNAEGYYLTLYNWVQNLLTDSPETRSWLVKIINEYYQDALTWLTDRLLPQAQQAMELVTGGLVSFINAVLDFLVGIIVSVYLLATKEGFAATGCKLLYSLFPQERAAWFIRGTKEVNRIFSGFFRGKLLNSFIIGVLCFIFSSIFKFPYAPLVSVVVGVTDVIPFFGPFLGAIPCAFLILLDSPIQCVYFILFILVLQQFDGNILGPKILGDSTGISSFWVIVAILVGGGLWGVPGMLVGVPLFACLYSAIRNYTAWRLARKGLPTDSASYTTHQPAAPAADEAAAPENRPSQQ